MAEISPEEFDMQDVVNDQIDAVSGFFGSSIKVDRTVKPVTAPAPAATPEIAVAQGDAEPKDEADTSKDAVKTEGQEVEVESAPAKTVKDPFGDQVARPSGIGPDAEGISEKSRAAEGRNLVTAVSSDNMISCGDPIEASPKMTAEEKHKNLMQEFNVPPRPDLWPPMMTWPNLNDLERLKAAKATREQMQQYWDALEEQKWKYLERAKIIDAWIRESDPKRIATKTFLERMNLRRNLAENKGRKNPYEKHDDRYGDEPYRGIAFASLMSPAASRAQANQVRSWGHRRVNMMDGGVVYDTKGAITFGRHDHKLGAGPSEQSIQFALREGKERGWKTFKVSGTPDFARMVEKYARELGVQAEISVYNTRTGGLTTRKRLVMGIPPLEEAGPDAFIPGGNAAKREEQTTPVQENDGHSEIEENIDVSPFDS